jgi:hypothetical protein
MLAEAIRKPDTERYANREETEEEYMYGLYCSARAILDGAKAIAQRASEDGNCNDCDKIYDLLCAFDAVMEGGEDAIQGIKKKDLPRITMDEFNELLGDVGGAEVDIHVNREGELRGDRYYVGKKCIFRSKLTTDSARN